jgi:hypothetical protein
VEVAKCHCGHSAISKPKRRHCARVGHLVDEGREIEIKLEVDGADAGLEERKANIDSARGRLSRDDATPMP